MKWGIRGIREGAHPRDTWVSDPVLLPQAVPWEGTEKEALKKATLLNQEAGKELGMVFKACRRLPDPEKFWEEHIEHAECSIPNQDQEAFIASLLYQYTLTHPKGAWHAFWRVVDLYRSM